MLQQLWQEEREKAAVAQRHEEIEQRRYRELEAGTNEELPAAISKLLDEAIRQIDSNQIMTRAREYGSKQPIPLQIIKEQTKRGFALDFGHSIHVYYITLDGIDYRTQHVLKYIRERGAARLVPSDHPLAGACVTFVCDHLTMNFSVLLHIDKQYTCLSDTPSWPKPMEAKQSEVEDMVPVKNRSCLIL